MTSISGGLSDSPERKVDDTLIQVITRRIVENFHPDRVILFGSRARGDFRADSDIDICVEMDSDEQPYERRKRVGRLFLNRWWPMDILVFTPAEMSRYSRSLVSIIPSIEREGRVLYSRKNG